VAAIDAIVADCLSQNYTAGSWTKMEVKTDISTKDTWHEGQIYHVFGAPYFDEKNIEWKVDTPVKKKEEGKRSLDSSPSALELEHAMESEIAEDVEVEEYEDWEVSPDKVLEWNPDLLSGKIEDIDLPSGFYNISGKVWKIDFERDVLNHGEFPWSPISLHLSQASMG
jgi:hypothetical protein